MSFFIVAISQTRRLLLSRFKAIVAKGPFTQSRFISRLLASIVIFQKTTLIFFSNQIGPDYDVTGGVVAIHLRKSGDEVYITNTLRFRWDERRFLYDAFKKEYKTLWEINDISQIVANFLRIYISCVIIDKSNYYTNKWTKRIS